MGDWVIQHGRRTVCLGQHANMACTVRSAVTRALIALTCASICLMLWGKYGFPDGPMCPSRASSSAIARRDRFSPVFGLRRASRRHSARTAAGTASCLRTGLFPPSCAPGRAAAWLGDQARLLELRDGAEDLAHHLRRRRRIGELARDIIGYIRVSKNDGSQTLAPQRGCDARNLAEQFNVKPAEIKRFLRGELDPARTRELTDEMLAADLPI